MKLECVSYRDMTQVLWRGGLPETAKRALLAAADSVLDSKIESEFEYVTWTSEDNKCSRLERRTEMRFPN